MDKLLIEIEICDKNIKDNNNSISIITTSNNLSNKEKDQELKKYDNSFNEKKLEFLIRFKENFKNKDLNLNKKKLKLEKELKEIDNQINEININNQIIIQHHIDHIGFYL
tara:strand:- start:106 stop:435 length:330 start_codon:yes stop_codon:yes gene_type:complete